MQTTDNSQTARVARRKQKILGESSSSRSSVTFRDYSIFQQQKLGNVRFIHQNVGGLVEDAPCGCPTVSVSSVVPEIKIDVVLENSGSANTFIAKYSPTGNVVWAARIGGSENEYGYGIATDTNNNIVVTGSYSSNPVYIYDASGGNFKTLEISGSSEDTFIAKYSPTGDVMWAARIGGTGSDIGYGIATDANNNIVVTGDYGSNPLTIYDASGGNFKTLENSGSNDTFIAKYSPTGTVLWAARISGTGEYGYGIATDANNNIVVIGSYPSNPVYIYDASGEIAKTLENSGSDDTFIVTYSPTGNVLWAARIGGEGYDGGRWIATDTNNNIVVTGSYTSNPLTIYDASGEDVKTLNNSSPGSSDTFIATYSPTGNVMWVARIGGTGSDIGYGIATDANNNIVVTGQYSSGSVTIYDASGGNSKTLENPNPPFNDTFIAKYSPTGSVLWAARIGGTGNENDAGNGIATDANNNIVVTGRYGSNPVYIYDASGEVAKTLDWSGSSGSDTFIATYSPTGSVLWAARIGGAGNDTGNGIATDTNNNIVVTGSYSSNPLTVYYAR